MFAKRSFNDGTELPIHGISFNLVVPHLGVKAGEPLAECLQLSRVEVLHFAFEILQTIHAKFHSDYTGR